MLVAICGLIGSGKSTLVSNLANKFGYSSYQEPVDNNPFLSQYYTDPKRWSFTLQVYYLWERYKQMCEAHMKSLNGEIVILDSTIYSDMAFALLQKQSGYFTKDEYATYLNMHKIIAAQTAYPDVLFFLQLSTEETAERIKMRSRDCESGIPIKYLEDLNAVYKTILDKLSKRTEVIYIDARKSADEVCAEVNSIIEDRVIADRLDELKYV